jgi:hypothetical protein
MSSFLDLAGDDSDAVPKKKSFLDLAEITRSSKPAAPTPGPGRDVAGAPLLAQSPQTLANVTADIQKTGAKTATFNGMPLEATSIPPVQGPGGGRGSINPAPPAQPPQNTPSPELPSMFGPFGEAGNLLTRGAVGAGNAIVGGYKGLAALMTGKGTQAASDAALGQTIAPPAATPAVAQAEGALASNANPANWAPRIGEAAGGALTDAGYPGLGAAATTLGAAVPLVAGGAMGRAGRAAEVAAPLARVEPAMVAANDASAAKPFTPPKLADAPPEIQQAVAQAQTAGTFSPTAAAAHVEASTLPVPARLTAGQALGDPAMISDEMNGRGKVQPTVSPQFYKEQGQAVAANLDAIRTKAAPDIPTTADMADHGQTLIDAYKQKAATAQEGISADYQALRDAQPGNVFLKGPDVKSAVAAALDTSEAHRSPFLPSAIQSAIGSLPDDMSLARFESLRTQLATAARSTSAQQDGNVMAAINAARSAVEALPMSDEAGPIKALADKARASARAQFQAVDADPAYSAAVNDSVPLGKPSPLADRFVNNYALRPSAARADVATMAGNLSDNPQAVQALRAAAVDHLTAQMKADGSTGNFTQAGYNKALDGLGGKLPLIADPETAYNLQAVGNFAKRAQVQPRGAYVNNSNTLVGSLAGKAATGLEKTANAAVPFFNLGTEAREALAKRAAANAAAKAVAPGAGISGSLADLAK